MRAFFLFADEPFSRLEGDPGIPIESVVSVSPNDTTDMGLLGVFSFSFRFPPVLTVPLPAAGNKRKKNVMIT